MARHRIWINYDVRSEHYARQIESSTSTTRCEMTNTSQSTLAPASDEIPSLYTTNKHTDRRQCRRTTTLENADNIACLNLFARASHTEHTINARRLPMAHPRHCRAAPSSSPFSSICICARNIPFWRTRLCTSIPFFARTIFSSCRSRSLRSFFFIIISYSIKSGALLAIFPSRGTWNSPIHMCQWLDNRTHTTSRQTRTHRNTFNSLRNTCSNWNENGNEKKKKKKTYKIPKTLAILPRTNHNSQSYRQFSFFLLFQICFQSHRTIELSVSLTFKRASTHLRTVLLSNDFSFVVSSLPWNP